MHEWSIAEGIVRSVLSFMKKHGVSCVREVVVATGELAQLDTDVLKEAFKLLSEDTPLAGAELRVEVERARFVCNVCGAKWGLHEIEDQLKSAPMIADETGEYDLPLHYMPELVYAFARCPRCGSRDFDVIAGMGVKVVRLVVEKGGGEE